MLEILLDENAASKRVVVKRCRHFDVTTFNIVGNIVGLKCCIKTCGGQTMSTFDATTFNIVQEIFLDENVASKRVVTCQTCLYLLQTFWQKPVDESVNIR